MSGFVVENGAESTVADNPLNSTATTINVVDGTEFPSTFPYRLTLWDKGSYPNPKDDSGMEIVHVTGRTGNALTAVRGQESTSGVEHSSGETIAMMITAGLFNDDPYGIQTILDSKIGNIVEDTTPQLGGDLDGQGNSLIACQSVANLAGQGAALYLDGANDYVNLDMFAVELVNVNNTEGAIVWKGKIHDLTTSNKRAWSFGDTNGDRYIYFDVPGHNQRLRCIHSVSSISWSFLSTNSFIEDKEYEIVVAHNGVEPVLYINGELEPISFSDSTDKTKWFSDATGIDNGRIGCLNYTSVGNISHSNITVNKFYALNVCPTAAEVLAMYEGGNVPYKYIGANQTDLTSGTLVFGKYYTIDTYVSGDDFTNIGGTNVTGNSFVATGTTPTVWMNSSVLRQTGCVLQFEQDSINNSQWLDKSGNKLHGEVSGALPINLPCNHKEQYPHLTSITTDTAWTDVVPAGYILDYIIFEGENANAATLDLGTTSSASDVFSQEIITGSDITTIVINKMFSKTVAQSLYLNDAGAGSWNSASLLATLYMSRVEV